MARRTNRGKNVGRAGAGRNTDAGIKGDTTSSSSADKTPDEISTPVPEREKSEALFDTTGPTDQPQGEAIEMADASKTPESTDKTEAVTAPASTTQANAELDAPDPQTVRETDTPDVEEENSQASETSENAAKTPKSTDASDLTDITDKPVDATEHVAGTTSDRSAEDKHDATPIEEPAGSQPEATGSDTSAPESSASDTFKASEPPIAAPTPPPPPPPKRGVFPLLLGGLLAGGIGFGAHYYLFGVPDDFSAEIASLQRELADLRGSVAAIPDAPDLSGIESDLADLRTALDEFDVSGEVAAGMDALRAEFASSDDVDREVQLVAQLNALAREVSQITQQLDTLEGAQGESATRLGGLQDEIAEIRDEIADVRDIAERRVVEAEASIDTSLARAGLEIMRAALDSGAAYPEAITLLEDAGVTVPDALAAPAGQGVQTLESLQESFPAAARAALRSTYQEDDSGGPAARLENFFRSQLGVRSTAPREGDDPDAILSRAGAMIAEGDLDGTLAELEALPGPAMAALAPWRDDALAHRDAHAAIDDFANTVTNQ